MLRHFIPDLLFSCFQAPLVRYVILFFYPFDFTFVCPTEIMAFNSVVDDLRAKGAEVLGISTDSVHSHLAYRRLEPSQGGWAPWLIWQVWQVWDGRQCSSCKLGLIRF